jgi:hypothetical protein
MDRLISDTEHMRSHQFIELGYDELDQRPLSVLREIYKGLELGAFEEDEDIFTKYLDSVKQYQKNPYSHDSETIEKVNRHWGKYVDHWGYEVPGKQQGAT